MQQALLRIAFDAGAREISSMLSGLVGAAVVSLLVIVFLPVILVASMLGAPSAGPTAPNSQTQAITAPLAPTTPSLPSPPSPSQGAGRIVSLARQYLGIPYVFGGTDPRYGLDCSGLVQLVFRQAGISLPRTAQLQFNATARLSRDELEPGDLVFFARTYDDPHDWITHVGIYIGNGMQINAPTEGEVVSIQPVFTGFWGNHFAGGGRA